MRWKGFVDTQSQVVLCELRVIDLADRTEVAHEGNLPCDGTEQQFEMTGLGLQHRLAIWLKHQLGHGCEWASREPFLVAALASTGLTYKPT